ncbi:MAG TPA: ATP-binding protein, partial [Firmicutes bacterium]|nr:ATP-binding protein [Bacillota bacterium]
FPPERVEDVKTAVGEAFINAVEHGNRGRADRQVTLRFHREGNALRVDVVDCGKGFDLNRLEVPHLRPKIEGRESRRGWGLFLMRRLADHLEVSRQRPSGSCLSMTIGSRPSSLDG